MPALDSVLSLQAKVAKAADRLRSPLLLALRLYFGWVFCTTGWGKLQNLDRTTEFFRGLSIPAPHANAVLAACTECFGGALFLAGLGSRFVAAALSFTMVVAMLTAHRDAIVHFFDDPSQLAEQTAFPFLVAALTVLAFGPGAISLDALLQRRSGDGSRKNQGTT